MAECRCGCGRPVDGDHRRRGAASQHLAWGCYQRWLRHGRPDVIPPPHASRAGRVEDYLELRSWGLTRSEAAARLGVSERTAERYERDLARAGAS